MNGQIDTTYEGWPIIQNQDPKNLASYGIGLLLLAGKLARISTDFIKRWSEAEPFSIFENHDYPH